MINDKKVVAIMPIKLKNERFQGKNIKLLGNKPLLQYQLEMLTRVSEIDEIYVYCSNPEIQSYLIDGVKYLKRDLKLDLPTANFSEIFKEFINDIDADIYVYTHATAPFVTDKTTRECIEAVAERGFDSSFCAVKIQDFLWKDNEPLNFDAQKIPRSQDLMPIWRETSGVYVFTKDTFINTGRRIGYHPFIKNVTLKESIDINEPDDFLLAEIFNKEEK